MRNDLKEKRRNGMEDRGTAETGAPEVQAEE